MSHTVGKGERKPQTHLLALHVIITGGRFASNTTILAGSNRDSLLVLSFLSLLELIVAISFLGLLVGGACTVDVLALPKICKSRARVACSGSKRAGRWGDRLQMCRDHGRNADFDLRVGSGKNHDAIRMKLIYLQGQSLKES